MVKLVEVQKNKLENIYSLLKKGDLYTPLNIIVDVIEEGNRDMIDTVFSSFMYSYYTISDESIDNFENEKLYKLEEKYNIPVEELVSIIDDETYKEYLLCISNGIKHFTKKEYTEAIESLEKACLYNFGNDTPRYFLCIIYILEKDTYSFLENYKDLSRKAIDIGMKDERKYYPSFPRDIRQILTELSRHSSTNTSIKESEAIIIREIKEALKETSLEIKEDTKKEADRVISTLLPMIRSVCDNISIARKEIINTIEDKEEVILKLIETTMDEVFKINSRISRTDLEQADKELEILFSKEIWHNETIITEETKIMLRTGEAIYKVLNNSEVYSEVEFSPAVIPLTKALENELYRHFFVKLKSFCSSKWTNFNRNWPAPLIYPSPYKRDYTGSFMENDRDFTLGSFNKIVNDSNFKRNVKNEFYQQTFNPSFNARNFADEIDNIKNEYRDKVAHKQGIGVVDAIKCREDMLKVKKVFVNFLKNILV